MMKLRVARPKYLIDIHRIADLNYIREEAGTVRFGAMTRHVQIEESRLIGDRLPILREAASEIGDAQVRNRGTIGGGLVGSRSCGRLRRGCAGAKCADEMRRPARRACHPGR